MPLPSRTAPATRPADRFARRRHRNRQALLDAAIDLFQQRGIRGVKIEDICERADVAPRTFFNHFETREHLYLEIAQQRASQFAALFDATAADPRPIRATLPELLGQIADYLDERPLYRELVGEMLRVRADGGSEIVRTGLLGLSAQRFVAAGVARGEIRAPVRTEVLADLLLGAINTALSNWSTATSYDLRRELREAADALLLLFTAPPVSGRRTERKSP
jgi:AcrR family transcriptional regulator